MDKFFAKSLGLVLICTSTVQVDLAVAKQESKAIANPKFTVSQGIKNTGIASPNNRQRPLTPQEQVEALIDVKGLWAETAVTTLVARNIMPAFRDSTFRPNDLVTRGEFRKILAKAFPSSSFTSGIISAPNEKLTRAQVIVFIVNGLNLNSQGVNLENTFIDAAKIPTFARSAITTAAAQKLLFSYPDVRFINPNESLSRLDLAALVYQALVIKGRLPPLQATDTAQLYLVGNPPRAIAKINNSAKIISTLPQPNLTPPQSIIDPEVIRQNLRVPTPTTQQFKVATKSQGSPSISLTVPSAFGASWGNAFVALRYLSVTRNNDGSAGGAALGFGLGDPKNLVGVELSYATFSLGIRNPTANNGVFSFKIHRLISDNTAIAFGIENALKYGGTDATPSTYGVISSIFQLEDTVDRPFSSLGLTIGLGNGRFRSISDVNNNKETVNIFGSVSLRVFEPVSLIADWNGQNLSIGASIKPFRDIPLVISPGFTDILGDNTNGTRQNGLNGVRFFLGVGYGINF